MGLNILGERKLRRIRRKTGMHNIVRAATLSHGHTAGRFTYLLVEAGPHQVHWHYWYDPATGEVALDENPTHWTSCEYIDPYYKDELK